MATPKSIKYSKLIVAAVILLNVIFAVATFWATVLGYIVPDALIVAWFAFTGTELLACAGIKISENKTGVDESADDSDEQPED